MALIPEWRIAWKLTSVQLACIGAALNAAAVGWLLFQGSVHPLLFASVNMALGIAVAISRVVQQPELHKPDE
ncbi:DUF7940 domain-containing protein [Pseudomonas abietaniphila]|uniref:DUF7940 domain-containing protein n=1 Tax=Pseudomonas abietaniphila TaxID=89065 RepID=UPI0007855C9F|nr:hypothetical protein [Pseudomonas abietaniphila]